MDSTAAPYPDEWIDSQPCEYDEHLRTEVLTGERPMDTAALDALGIARLLSEQETV